jgi:predicted  nucleic acid-binding Zn-ribbon protein
MSRSKTLFQLQQYDSELDSSYRRIKEIETILAYRKDLESALLEQEQAESYLQAKQKTLRSAELQVEDQNLKITQNEKKLYSGAVTNPKDLEDLQLESSSLKKYLLVLEERQLEAMVEAEQAQEVFNQAVAKSTKISNEKTAQSEDLNSERTTLEMKIETLLAQRKSFLENTEIPDLGTYNDLRKSHGGVAVTLMINASCSSCGANIPSAIEQEAKSPGNISTCPTCKRILHPKSV